jgi:hypothetical protein
MHTLKIINGRRIWVSDTPTHIDPSERAQGHIGRKLLGGLPPAKTRNSFSNIAGVHAAKSKPNTYRHASPQWHKIEREFKQGLRAYDVQGTTVL